MSVPVLQLCLFFVGCCHFVALGLEQCPRVAASAKGKDAVCPDKNTCCSFGCVSNNMGSYNATCCDDHTACPEGYICRPGNLCEASPERANDPLLRHLPRYTLCPSSPASLYNVHDFPIKIYNQKTKLNKEMVLPYYSSHGSILAANLASLEAVQMALVVIHGGARNADDYYCPLLAARNLQQTFPTQSVLVLAPRFLAANDTNGRTSSRTCGDNTLRFGGNGHGKWRYGHSAQGFANFTSFDALDRFIEYLIESKKRSFPNLKQIVIAGHSVGAQFCQRWSLLTHLEWNAPSIKIKAVVANPSSWAYLTPKRLINGTWKLPVNPEHCPYWNDWTWGLARHAKGTDATILASPYKNRVVRKLGVAGVIRRYKQRDVTYLAGSLDMCNTTGRGKWCQSHDLGTTCADQLQGSTRWDRHENFVQSLNLVGIYTHQSKIVPGTGHDHAMMFTSFVGLSVLFPEMVQHGEAMTSMQVVERLANTFAQHPFSSSLRTTLFG